MDSIYSLFYTGRSNPYRYGFGTWDSSRPTLNRSKSQIMSVYDKLPLINNQKNYPKTKREKKKKKYKIRKVIPQTPYDIEKSRRELSTFVKDINNSIAVRLQNENFIAQQKLNKIKNNYNEIKSLINNRIDKLEHDQEMQFINLKYALEMGGGLKMMGAVRNAEEGNNYDLDRAEEQDMYDAAKKLPKIVEDRIDVINDMKKKEKQEERKLYSDIRQKVRDEIRLQKEKDELRFRDEINEIERKRDNIHEERLRLLDELRRDEFNNSIMDDYSRAMPPPPYYPYPPMNNNEDSTNSFLKMFLLKKLLDDT